MRIALYGNRAVVLQRVVSLCVLAISCTKTEEYQVGQPLEMGPFKFEVTSAANGTWGSYSTVDLSFQLLQDDSAPFTTDFKEYFGYKMEIVDGAGNAFPVDPDPIDPVYRSGRPRAARYVARVRLSTSHEGVRDADHLGKAASDYKLMIDNPAPEGAQPRRVSIQLH